MPPLPIKVFSKHVAAQVRGPKAIEPLPCPSCGDITCAYLSPCNTVNYQGHNTSGQRYTSIVTERWRCASCLVVYIERYGVYNFEEWK